MVSPLHNQKYQRNAFEKVTMSDRGLPAGDWKQHLYFLIVSKLFCNTYKTSPYWPGLQTRLVKEFVKALAYRKLHTNIHKSFVGVSGTLFPCEASLFRCICT
jgi:hypothetical protein